MTMGLSGAQASPGYLGRGCWAQLRHGPPKRLPERWSPRALSGSNVLSIPDPATPWVSYWQCCPCVMRDSVWSHLARGCGDRDRGSGPQLPPCPPPPSPSSFAISHHGSHSHGARNRLPCLLRTGNLGTHVNKWARFYREQGSPNPLHQIRCSHLLGSQSGSCSLRNRSPGPGTARRGTKAGWVGGPLANGPLRAREPWRFGWSRGGREACRVSGFESCLF